MAIIVRGDAPNTFDLLGFEFEQGQLKLAGNGKSYVFNPKLDIEASDLMFTDAEGKEYPLALANAASLRLPFLTPAEMAADLIDTEVTERKNANRAGKKPLLSKAAKKRNRIRKAAEKWRDANWSNNSLGNIIFSELVADARNEYIEENSETRISRKVLAAQKRREAGTYSVPECEAAIVAYRLVLNDVNDIARAELESKIKELEALILTAQGGGRRDVEGANLLASGTLAEHLVTQA